MRKIIVLVLTLSFTYLNAQNKITVKITNINPISGDLYVGLYNSKATFLKEGYKSIKVTVDSNTALVVFDSIPNGIYAISTFHDANSNKKFDTYIFGIPKEGYSFSNNARGMFGPASYEDASFEIVNEDIKQVLKH